MVKKIHLTGIGGVGMAALAVLLKRRGAQVDGCDLAQSPRTQWLDRNGIPVRFGHDVTHVLDSDLVVVTPAVHRDNPEFASAEARGILRYRGQILADLVSNAADSIAVCGTHGKTTTSTYIARLLIALGEDVEWAIGGETGAFPVAGVAGPGRREPVLVVEADESDGTLAEYHAGTLVVTNCEYDHPDHFPTPQAYFACFDAARAKARTVLEGSATNEETARRVALARGHSAAAIDAVLPTIAAELPDRRFQRILPISTDSAPDSANLPLPVVYTDYGHHPTEVRYAIAKARRLHPDGVLRVLFQPHRYSRTKALLENFARAFDEADEVVICPTYAAFEPAVEGGSHADLYRVIRERFIATPELAAAKVFLARSCGEAWEHARNAWRPGDITLIQGAGDIIALAAMARRELAAMAAGKEFPRRQLIIGHGTNTWRSDLRLDETYVTVTGAAAVAGVSLLAQPELAARIPFMAGIPGTLGGWVKMNAGAFGHSISEAIAAVIVDGRRVPVEACGFGYRTSAIAGRIEAVEFRDDPPPAGLRTVAEYRALRPPFPAGTKGSVFKNPVGDHAGRLLEAAGCKRLRVGGAYVWERHANVIVAGRTATASDFLALAEMMHDAVKFRFGIDLKPEVCGLCC